MNKEQLRDCIKDYIYQKKLAEKALNTILRYQKTAEMFIEWLPKYRILNKETLLDFKEYLLSKSERVNTLNSWITDINNFMKYLYHKGYIEEELRINKMKKQFQTTLKDIITPAEYKRMLRVAKSHGYVQDHYIMRILGETGIRIEELKYFTYENLEKTPFNPIHVRNKSKSRDVYLTQTLSRDLKRYCRDYRITEGTLFPSKDPKCEGKQINKSTIFRHQKQIANLSYIKKEKIHSHSFRHFFSIQYLETYPNDLAGLADILGHSDINTTRIYTKTSGANLRHKLERVKI